MGKKARKTRWRTLEITDEQSDSEGSHTNTTPRIPRSFQPKSYYSKLPYSSQSTPRRKYQHDGTKSTRSSSTASENKITFNEDEYTRITTPRQDVLFKKGYLSKPKNYQTQTSTGTSTTSTGNSTGNGTPDHQSTDLEYDSQFVFPNGFVDQNGIYYVNSFEPYPLMLYNPPTYYTECSNSKSKRYSTGSLTESTSPNNEEATSQDLSGGEASNNVSDYSSHHSVYNMVYPGYYVNGVCPTQEIEMGQYPPDQTRRMKKRRRRKTSRSQTNNQSDSTECSEDEDMECEEPAESEKLTTTPDPPNQTETTDCPATQEVADGHDQNEVELPEISESNVICEESKSSTETPKPQKYDLKPDAEEFVPRAYRTPEIPLSPVQFIKVPPNFMPIPVVPFNGQINPAFIPPGGIPINFLPPDPKLFPPNFVNFVPGHPKNEEISERVEESKEDMPIDQQSKVCDNSNTAKEELPPKIEKPSEKVVPKGKTIDIATIVSKLEEAAKEQEENEEDKAKTPESEHSPKQTFFKTNQKYRNNHKKNFYISPKNSPQRQYVNETKENEHIETEAQTNPKFARNSPEKFRRNWKSYQNPNGNSKWLPNSAHRSPKQNPRLVEAPQIVKHYSDTLKNHQVPKKPVTESPKTRSVPSSPKVCLPTKLPDQWISVSSRKKRKTKNLEENDASFEDTAHMEEEKDEFESYDVNMLVDVVPLSKTEEDQEETIKVEITEEKVGNIINIIAQTESDSIQNNCLTPDIRSVTEIENELMVQPEKTEVDNGIGEIKLETEIVEEVEETKSKKKTKKGSQKTIAKRVIITDIDVSEKSEEVKAPVKKVVKKIEKPKETPEIKESLETPDIEKPRETPEIKKSSETPEIKVEEAEIPVSKQEVVIEKIEEADRKKNKKKKKKTSKGAVTIVTNSLSSSSTTLSVTEDAYDLLLDTSLATETDKTNDEISVELDKMIQKGIYSSLEEKIKTLNISENDGFFKSVFSKVPVTGRTEAAGFLKSPDFTKIPLFKSDLVSEDQSLETRKINDELPASDSSEISLENPVMTAVLPDATESTIDEQKSLYPITEAVKEWMCRTRETTPDVEIFKSPSIIFKEFCESETNSDTEVCNSRDLSDELSASVEEDEITLFTTDDADKTGEGINEDLLEYWEDLKTEESKKSDIEVNLTEDEDELEVYESKYGTNEDFLKLQKEIREKTKVTNYPKHGNLPYRAICCNVM